MGGCWEMPHTLGQRSWIHTLKFKLCMCSIASVQLFAMQWTVAHQAPLSMEFSKQEYWSRLPCSSPRDIPDPGIEPASLTSPALAGRFFTTSTEHRYYSGEMRKTTEVVDAAHWDRNHWYMKNTCRTITQMFGVL